LVVSSALENDRYNYLYRFPVHIDSYDYRAICLFFACLIYALFGSPTPDSLSIVEILVGILLALAIGIGRARDAILRPVRYRFWKSAGQLFLLYGLSVPFIVAVLNGYDLRAILRDFIPFLFLFLPLFLLPLIRARPYYFRSILFAFILIGLLFSLRSILMRYDLECKIWCVDELLYLENMPSVLFAALFLIGSAIAVMTRGLNIKNVIIFFVLMALSVLPIVAMISTIQRASLGAIALYVIVIQGYFIYKSPVRGGNALLMMVIVAMVINFSFTAVFASLWDKTQNVGLNMRPQEMEAVWQLLTSDLLTFLFGIGWGGHFNSPAVGGLSVNFTHNFFSSIFLKTGIIGLTLSIAYIAGLLERLSRVLIKSPVLGLALFLPIFIDLTLYASFKSLDFGLAILMISGSLVYFRQPESVSETLS